MTAPPILQNGFRPLFLLASLHAGLAIPAWIAAFLAGFAGLWLVGRVACLVVAQPCRPWRSISHSPSSSA